MWECNDDINLINSFNSELSELLRGLLFLNVQLIYKNTRLRYIIVVNKKRKTIRVTL